MLPLLASRLIISNNTLNGAEGKIEEIILSKEMNVEVINISAFKDNINLKKVQLSLPIKKILSESFCNCTNLKEVSISNSIILIDDRAFYNCTNAEITLHYDDKLEIGYGAFYKSTISNIIIINNKVNLKYNSFQHAIFKNDVTITSEDYQTAFNHARFDEELNINSKVIPSNAFFGCTISWISFRGVEELEPSCFENAMMNKFKINTFNPRAIKERAFYNASIYKVSNFVFSGPILLGIGAFQNSNIKGSMDFSLCTSQIPNYFAHNSTINNEIILSKNSITVGEYAFANSMVNRIVLNNFTFVSSYAFSECNNLKEIINPDRVMGGQGIFQKCQSLKSVEDISLGTTMFKDSVIERVKTSSNFVPNGCFENCSFLKEVVFIKGCDGFDRYAFLNCVSLSTIFIPKFIGDLALSGSGITSVLIYGNISQKSFESCPNLKNITLRGGITVPANAFRNCTAIQNIIIEDVNSLNDLCFCNCTIKVIEFRHVEIVKERAFEESTVDVVIYKMKKVFDMKKKLFANTPKFIFTDFKPNGNLFGYTFTENTNIIIFSSITAAIFIAVVVGLILFLIRKNKKLQDRILLEQSIMTDFG